MEPITLSAVATAIASIVMDKAVEKLSEPTLEKIKALREGIQKQIKDNPKNNPALVLVENSDSKSLPGETIEIIAESLEEEIIKDREFAKDLQEKSEQIFEKINMESPELAEEIKMEIDDILKKIHDDIKKLTNEIKNISINTANADFIGRDNALFAGIPKTSNQSTYNYIQHFYNVESEDSDNNNSSFKEHKINKIYQVKKDYNSIIFGEDIKNIVEQIKRTRSGITKLIPVESSLLNLEELRKPKPILNYDDIFNILLVLEVISSRMLSFLFIGKQRTLMIQSIKTFFTQPQDLKVKNRLEDQDLVELQNIEFQLEEIIETRKNFDLRNLKLKLNRANDRVNVRIGVINDSFISLLYPASSSKELVANMVTRIGHQELREEAEMHLNVISGIVSKLNRLVEKFNIEKFIDENTQKINKENYVIQNSEKILKTIIESLDEESLRKYTAMIKDIANQRQDKINDKNLHEEKEFYILSDEAQAAVGIMTEIEQRRLVVEKLVRSDRNRQNFTIFIVICYIASIIYLTFISYFKFGSNPIFVVGNDLNKTKLAFLGIPWPVALWSLIGSFAAMIYRFNRQPIYNFTDAIKWMLTRPVQGLVLGSAFYLVLASGLFLLGGNSFNSSSGLGKVSSEIILVLSFLVGFSDRFADTVFNALVDKYSSKESNKKEQKDNE